MTDKKKWVSGIDLGGTKTLIVAKTKEGEVLDKLVFKTDAKEGPEPVFQHIEKTLLDLTEKLKAPPSAIGIGIAGQIDKKESKLLFGPNLGWKEVDIKEKLKRFNCPIAVLNDVRAATLGEWKYGSGKGFSNLACIFIGTGIGGGFVTDGKLLEGANNSAGEIGHMVVDMNGPKCTCGNFGCLEAFAGGWAIAENARQLIKKHPEKGRRILELAKGDILGIDGKIITKAYNEKDPLATIVIELAIKALTAGVLSIIHAVNPSLLIFGGGIVDGLPDIVTKVEKEVRSRGLNSALSNLSFKKAALEKEAVAIGATIPFSL